MKRIIVLINVLILAIVLSTPTTFAGEADMTNPNAQKESQERDQEELTQQDSDKVEGKLLELCTLVLNAVLEPNMTDCEKAYAIYSWVEHNISYVSKPEYETWQDGALDTLTTYSGDCYAFYSLLRALLTCAGFECVEASSVSKDHYWVMANIDGSWWHLDATPGWGKDRFMLTTQELLDYRYYGNEKYRNGLRYDFDPAGYPETEGKKAIYMDETEAAVEVSESKAGTELPAAENKTGIFIAEQTEEISLDPQWEYANYSEINSGHAVLYRASTNRKNYIVGVNAGHGTKGGTAAQTYCHPDHTPKVTGGSTAEDSIFATAVSDGMVFPDGTSEAEVTLMVAEALRDKLLANGYDVLMIRDGDDVQLDNIARTVICNNVADCHIAIHFDSDTVDYDKGCFYISVPDALKEMEPVCDIWQESEALGRSLVDSLAKEGVKVYGSGEFALDLTQTSYSTIPSVDIELGNQCSDISEESVETYAEGLFKGIVGYIKR